MARLTPQKGGPVSDSSRRCKKFVFPIKNFCANYTEYQIKCSGFFKDVVVTSILDWRHVYNVHIFFYSMQ